MVNAWLAVPATTVLVPRGAVPLKNCTEPTAVDGATVALSVMFAGATAVVAGVDTSDVVVVTGAATTGAVTTKLVTADVEPAKAAASVGVKTALYGCVPAITPVNDLVATPTTTVLEPSEVVPSKNSTEPEDVGLTVAVKVGAAGAMPEGGATASVVAVVAGAGTPAAVTTKLLIPEVDVAKFAGVVGRNFAV